jgi:hypothetical protein
MALGDFSTLVELMRRRDGFRVDFARPAADLCTPLMAAARHGREDLVSALLRDGASCRAQLFPTGESADALAACAGHAKLARRLLQRRLREEDEMEAFWGDVRGTELEVAMIRGGVAPLAEPMRELLPPLTRAAIDVRFLDSHKTAELQANEKWIATQQAAMTAEQSDWDAAVFTLMSMGDARPLELMASRATELANFQRVCADLSTALMAAARHDNQRLVTALLGAGASTRARDIRGMTADLHASAAGHFALARAL